MNPDAGDADPGTQPIPPKSLQPIVANIYGGEPSIIAPAGDLTAGAGSVIGSSARGGDISSTAPHVEGDVHQAIETRIETGERPWFARHPWISGISLGVVTGLLPAIYLAIWGPHWP